MNEIVVHPLGEENQGALVSSLEPIAMDTFSCSRLQSSAPLRVITA